MRFDTAHNKNSHCVPPPRVSLSQVLNSYYHEARTAVGVPHVQQSMSVWPEWAGCMQGCEVDLP